LEIVFALLVAARIEVVATARWYQVIEVTELLVLYAPVVVGGGTRGECHFEQQIVDTFVLHLLGLKHLEGSHLLAGTHPVDAALTFATHAAEPVTAVIAAFQPGALGDTDARPVDATFAGVQVARHRALVAVGRVSEQVRFAAPLYEPIAVAKPSTAIGNRAVAVKTTDSTVFSLRTRLVTIAAMVNIIGEADALLTTTSQALWTAVGDSIENAADTADTGIIRAFVVVRAGQ